MSTEKNKNLKLIKFEQDGCSPCKAMDMFFDSKGFKDYEKVNPFDSPHLAVKYDVGKLPTVVLVDSDGNEVQRSVGFNPPELEELISKL